MAIVEVKAATKVYGQGAGEVRALRGVSLEVDPGEFTVISGPSGSGKSTLLNLIGCLDTPSSGQVLLEGQDIQTLSGPALANLRARRIGFIFQSFNLVPVLTALENVELALQLAGTYGQDGRARAEEALRAVGLGDYLLRRPNQLSGGQQQRVAVARALVKQPALVIADEPTANLDSSSGYQVLDIMRGMNEGKQITFLFSTHDPRVMERARRVVTLADGQITQDDRRGH
jgi:putative ABC transport system ATP-binding protein